MIPLYNSKPLADADFCNVTQELNGVYELELHYPVGGIMFGEIKLGGTIEATVDPFVYTGHNRRQKFIVDRITSDTDGIATIHAQHMSYLLGSYFVALSAGTLSTWTSLLNTYAQRVPDNPFHFNNAATSTARFDSAEFRSIQSILFDEENSLVKTMQLEVYRDNGEITFANRLGADRGVYVMYGRNIESYIKEVGYSSEKYIDAIAFWERTYANVHSSNFTSGQLGNVLLLNMNDDYESQPTVQNLNDDVVRYKQAHPDEFVENISTVEIEYYNLPGENVLLGDTVHVRLSDALYTEIDDMRVTKVVYDTLLDRYASISVGDQQETLPKTIARLIERSR